MINKERGSFIQFPMDPRKISHVQSGMADDSRSTAMSRKIMARNSVPAPILEDTDSSYLLSPETRKRLEER